jgi:hypothetical protein
MYVRTAVQLYSYVLSTVQRETVLSTVQGAYEYVEARGPSGQI